MSALWDGTTLNEKAASAFNRMLDNKTISITKRKNALVYEILGKKEPGSLLPDGRLSFEKLNRVTGKKHELKLQGRTRSFGTLSDGAQEVETATLDYQGDTFAGIEFDLTHIFHKEPIPVSDYETLVGDDVKTESYFNDIINMLAESDEADMATRLWAAANNQTRTTMGSIPFIVDNATAYGLDRSVPENADHRSNVNSSTGTLTLAKIAIEQNRVVVGGGSCALGLGDVTQYSKVQELVRDQLHAYTDPQWDRFGGQYLRFGATVFALDQRMPSASIYLLSPEYWTLVMKDSPIMSKMPIYDPSRNAAYVIPINMWKGIFCKKCAAQGKMTGIS